MPTPIMPVRHSKGKVFEERHVNPEGAKGPCFIWAVEFTRSTRTVAPLNRGEFDLGSKGRYSGLLASACWNGTAYLYGTDKQGQWQVVREVTAGPGQVLDRVFDISLVEVDAFKETGKPTTLLVSLGVVLGGGGRRGHR